MGALDEVRLLELWGRVRDATGPAALAALARAGADDGPGDVDVREHVEGGAGRPLGAAHADLVRLHRVLAGPALESTLACPDCGEVVEFALDADELLARGAAAAPVEPVAHDGWHVTWSPLTVGDLLAAATEAGELGGDDLLARVVEEVKDPDGAAATVEDLPATVVDALAAAQLAADPLVEVVVDLRCAACDERVEAVVDLPGHARRAVEVAAVRLLDDVADLAAAFGWSEPEVLAVPAWRRRVYLERVRGEDRPPAVGASP